jgi:NTE family protein
VAGTSAGAITAAVVAAGYKKDEMEHILKNVPFPDFKDESRMDKWPLGHVVSVLTDKGIYEGDFFEGWIRKLLEDKGISKFGDDAIVNKEATNPKHRYKLRVIASDVTERRMLVLPDDAGVLGVHPDELDVAYAVRMSMSIPIFFEPVIHENGDDKHLIVDGGMLSNFPVWLFDSEDDGDPRWPTFGLRLVEPEPTKAIGHRVAGESNRKGSGSLIDYVKNIALTMMAAHDRLYLEKATYARTIPIPTLGIGTTEFDITPERVTALYNSGYNATLEFLETWNFEQYIEEFRRGKEHSRRDDLVTAMEAPAPVPTPTEPVPPLQ